MKGFMAWHMILNPDLLIETAPMKAILADSEFENFRSKPRVEQLKFGKIGRIIAQSLPNK